MTLIKRALCSALCLIQFPVFSLNPVPGWYGGIFLGVSAAPNSTFTFENPITFSGPNVTLSVPSGQLSRSVLGDVGGQIGYRFCDRYRIEGEVMYNNNPFNTLQLQNVTISNTYYTPANTTPPNNITYTNVDSSPNAHIQGDTNTGAFMINAIYDMFTIGRDGYSTVVPFVGAGLGYSYVQNSLQFYRMNKPGVTESNTARELFTVLQTRTTYAGQLIAGVHYFMDDFTWFSADVRYFTTGSSEPSSEYTYITPTALYHKHSRVNLFGHNTQLISANISFNGAFNLG